MMVCELIVSLVLQCVPSSPRTLWLSNKVAIRCSTRCSITNQFPTTQWEKSPSIIFSLLTMSVLTVFLLMFKLHNHYWTQYGKSLTHHRGLGGGGAYQCNVNLLSVSEWEVDLSPSDSSTPSDGSDGLLCACTVCLLQNSKSNLLQNWFWRWPGEKCFNLHGWGERLPVVLCCYHNTIILYPLSCFQWVLHCLLHSSGADGLAYWEGLTTFCWGRGEGNISGVMGNLYTGNA